MSTDAKGAYEGYYQDRHDLSCALADAMAEEEDWDFPKSDDAEQGPYDWGSVVASDVPDRLMAWILTRYTPRSRECQEDT